MENEINNGSSEQINNEEQGSTAIVEFFKRVVTDEEFKQLLLSNPDEAVKSFELSEAQILMVKNLSSEDIEKLTPENIQEFFSADAAVYTPDETDAVEGEEYSIDDFDDLDIDKHKEESK